MLGYIAQGIGFIGLIISILSFQKNSNKGILSYQIISSFTFFIHFMMLGAYTGAILNIAGSARNAVFFNRDKRWANNKAWLYIFMAIYLVTGFLTWQNYFSLLPLLGMIIQTISLWIKNPKYTRFLNLIVSPCWLIYNIVNFSIAGTLTEIFILLSIIIAIFRYDIGSKLLKKSEEI